MNNIVKRTLFIVAMLAVYMLIGALPNGIEIQRLLGCFAIGWVVSDIAGDIFKS